MERRGPALSLFPGLLAGEITFEHRAHDGLAAFAELAEYFAGDEPWRRWSLLELSCEQSIMMGRAIPSLRRRLLPGHVLRLIVGFSAAAAQDDMPVRVAHGLDDRGLPIGIDAHKMVRGSRRVMAFTATCRLPSVPFLKPTGIDTPLAISRWVWLSVVRAPMAVQLTEIGNILRTDRIQAASVAQGMPD